MSCCGDKRKQAGGALPAPSGPGSGAASAGGTSGERQFVAWFEYFGNSGMTVLGPVTRRRYRFDGPGARVAADLRDRPSLLQVPKLREVFGP